MGATKANRLCRKNLLKTNDIYQSHVLSSYSKDCFDKSGLRDNISLCDAVDLFFANHIHRFNPAQCSSCRVKRLEPHHRLHNALDVPMLLLDNIIQIFALPSALSTISSCACLALSACCQALTLILCKFKLNWYYSNFHVWLRIAICHHPRQLPPPLSEFMK